MNEAIFLDTGSIGDISISGPAGFDVLASSSNGFITTEYVLDELPANVRRDFEAWSAGRNDVTIADVDIDLFEDTIETRRLGVAFRENGLPPRQLGDASLRWLEEKTGLISDGSVRVLTNDRGLAEWANGAAPDGVTGAYSTTLELIGEALLDDRISATDYSSLLAGLEGRIAANYAPEFRELGFSPQELTQLSNLEASGVSLSGTSIVAIAGTVELLRQAGVVGDVFSLAVTSVQASELTEQGRIAEAEQVWAGYFGNVVGGAAGALAGTTAAGIVVSATGVGAAAGAAILVAGALVGGYGGGEAGEAFAVFLAAELQEKLANGEPILVDDIIAARDAFALQNDLDIRGYVGYSIRDGAEFLTRCFVGDTMIEMWPINERVNFDFNVLSLSSEAHHIWRKPIEEICVGDIVLSFDNKGNLAPGKVTKTFKNEVKIILDFFGTGVTPGHVYYRSDSKKSHKFETLIDVLRDDGVIQNVEGVDIRAATGLPTSDARDGFVWAVTGQLSEGSDSVAVVEQAKIRRSTRIITDDGRDLCVEDFIVAGGGAVNEDGFVCIGDQQMPFHWIFGDTLPKPEDYVLQRSGTTLEEIYKASEWEDQRPHMPVPMVRDGGPVQPLSQAGLSAMPANAPKAFEAGATPTGPVLNRKHRKAAEAKLRKFAKPKKTVH